MGKHFQYPEEVKEYVLTRLETCFNYTQLARQTINHFNLDLDVESLRRTVSNWDKKARKKKSKQPIKRLFFDVETSYLTAVGIWRCWNQTIRPNQLRGEIKIICVSYKWQFEDKVHTLKWNSKQDDYSLVKKFIKVLGEADEIVAHNGDRFDMKELRTRAIKHDLLMYPNYRTNDTLKKARKYFNFKSNKLDYIGEFLNIGRKLDHEGIDLWTKTMSGDSDALQRMVDYCEQDVILLEDAFVKFAPYVDHNTNFAVLKGGYKWQCPECASKNVELHHTDTTPKGWVHRWMKCKSCRKQYKISNKSYLSFLSKAK